MAYDEYALDLTAQSTPAAITQYSVVVYDTTTVGFAKLPAATLANKIMGVAMSTVTAINQTFLVRFLGVAKVIANGSITHGDLLVVATSAGDVLTNNAPAATNGKVGTAMETAVTTQVIACALQIGQA